MLRNVKELLGYAIGATDGALGKVDDLYFDDERWAVRYFVVDTSHWLSGRKVLISPIAVGHPDWMGRLLPVSLTKSQVEKSPNIDTQMPVSRQLEEEYFGYYGYPYYWGGVGLWGIGAFPGSLTVQGQVDEALKATWSKRHAAADSHLRGCRAVIGNHVHATDGDIGHVSDLLVDEHTWAIRYLIVNTSNWWLGHHVLVAPSWITDVSWPEAKVSVNLTRQAIKDAPPFDATAQFNRQQEEAMYEHYGRSGYWTPEAVQDAAKQSPKDGSF